MATLAELFQTVHEFVSANYPGRVAVHLTLHLLDSAEPVSLPVPSALPATIRSAPQAFVPTPFQRAILDALTGRALRTDALAGETGNDRRRLFRHPGGLRELKEHRLVGHHDRLGYFRLDAPPDELVSEIEGG